MDPATVIVVIAVHLICSGGLLHLIGRRMPPRGGLGLWAGGLALFGLADVVRLFAGLEAVVPWAPLADAAMFAAPLLVLAGLREFLGGDALARRRGATIVLGFLAAEVAAIAWSGTGGRYAVLNLGLAALYAWIAGTAAVACSRAGPALRRPLALLAALVGTLAALTALRGAHIGAAGMAVAFRGPFAQVFYVCASLAAVLLAMTLLWMVFARLNGQLAELATRDALTRALNRAGLDDALRRHFGARRAPPLVLLALDVDHFKRVNDTHGHATGDLVLRALADTLAAHVRPNDLVARTGGEEFAVACVGAEPAAARALAERLREAAATVAVRATDGRSVVCCTVSVGLSQPFADLTDWPRAAGEADRALYAAKAAGRDRVCAAPA